MGNAYLVCKRYANITYANDIPIASVMYEKKKERIKLISEEGCGFIEKPYIDGFVTFLMSNLISNGIEIKYSIE